jgi:hypothetical protein
LREGYGIRIVGVLLIILTGSLLAADGQKVIVKGSSVGKDVVLVNIDVNGKAAQLSCFRSVRDCTIPKPGDYLMVRLVPEKAVYMDCPNVDLYIQPASSGPEKRVGEYCYLGDEER